MNWEFLGFSWWLGRSQWSPPQRLRRFQERRLRALVAHADAQCAYHQQAFAERGITPERIRTLGDLPRLPLLTRRAVTEELAALTARNAQRFHPEVSGTAGPGGAHLEFLRDRRAVNVGNAALWRIRGWHGIHPGDRIAELRTAVWRRPTGEPDYARVSEYLPRSNTLRLNLLGPQADRRVAVAQELSRFRPQAVRGSPLLLTFFSLFLLEHPEHIIRPSVVFAGGERLSPEQRRIIGEAFRAAVVETYGNWEYAVFAGECPAGRLHLAAEMGIVEIVRAGMGCPPGEPGDVVVTNLWNRSLPFLRYAIGDQAYLEDHACPCGRGLPTWRVVGGREKDLLATPEGHTYVTPEIVATPRWRRKIAGIRFYQETRFEVLVQIVRGPAFVDQDLETLYAELNEYLGGRLRISFEFCATLEPVSGGRSGSVVSLVPTQA